MLARSTFGLIFWFAVFYWVLSASGGFKLHLNDFRDAMYFSATTRFSIGQEGQEVEWHALRFLHVYEGVAGFVLLAVALSIYASPTRKKLPSLLGRCDSE